MINERTADHRQAQRAVNLAVALGNPIRARRWNNTMHTQWFWSKRPQPGCFAHMRHRGLRCHGVGRPSARSKCSQSAYVYSAEIGYSSPSQGGQDSSFGAKTIGGYAISGPQLGTSYPPHNNFTCSSRDCWCYTLRTTSEIGARRTASV